MPNDKDKHPHKGNTGKSASKNTSMDSPNSNETSQVPIIQPYNGSQSGYFPPFGLPGFPGLPGQQSAQLPWFYRPPLPSYPTQSHDNSNIIELFHEMNTRLKSIELSVAKIGPMEQDLTYLKSQMLSIHDSNITLTRKVSEIERSCQFNSEIFDQIISSREKNDTDIRNLKQQNSTMESNIQSLETKNIELVSRCLDLQSKSMENDLIIFGIKEARPTDEKGEHMKENVELTLKESLTSKLVDNPAISYSVTSQNLNFDKVYRVGNPVRARETGRPRPIIARFEKMNDRNIVRQAGISLNILNEGIKIHEHFPREIEERRKKLYPISRHLSGQGEKVALVKDRLYVNNQLFNTDSGKYTDKSGRTSFLRHPSFQVNPRENSDDRYDKRRTQDNSHQYRQAPNSHYVTNPSSRSLTFETPNRFKTLASMDVERQSQKRKDRSPLESDGNLKRNATDGECVQWSDKNDIRMEQESVRTYDNANHQLSKDVYRDASGEPH